MADIIDLGEERERREAPDAEYVRRDDFGRKMFCYLLDYKMGGKSWSAEVWAYDERDAENRAQAMRETLSVSGQIYTVIEG